MLTLPIKRKWFDMIKAGIKKEEYREIKPYYDSRFKELGVPTVIRLRAGYSKDVPVLECNVIITKGKGKQKWGAEPGVEYYVLSIISVKTDIFNLARAIELSEKQEQEEQGGKNERVH